MALIKCPECGAEVSDKASYCPKCGCPVGTANAEVGQKSLDKSDEKKQKNMNKKIVPIIIGSILVIIIGIVIYNIKIVQPQKYYKEAIGLLEQGKYEEGEKILKSITGYKDVDTILEQIKWESRVCECITEIRQYLKNPDSLQVYEVVFYDGYKEDLDDKLKGALKNLVDLTGDEPVCVMHTGGQNGFGGNTTGYALFMYQEGAYKYIGSCESLDINEIDEDDKEESTVCGIINMFKEHFEQVGSVDLARIKSIIKNDSYSTIKIIE